MVPLRIASEPYSSQFSSSLMLCISPVYINIHCTPRYAQADSTVCSACTVKGRVFCTPLKTVYSTHTQATTPVSMQSRSGCRPLQRLARIGPPVQRIHLAQVVRAGPQVVDGAAGFEPGLPVSPLLQLQRRHELGRRRAPARRQPGRQVQLASKQATGL